MPEIMLSTYVFWGGIGILLTIVFVSAFKKKPDGKYDAKPIVVNPDSPLLEPQTSLQTKIEQLVKKDQIKEAIDLLIEVFQYNPEKKREAILLARRFAELSRDKRKKILKSSEYGPEINKISDTILELKNYISE